MLLAEALNNDAGGEEQQRLEEGVRHEMEDGGRPGADPERQEHVADLADRRVGQDALEVGLIERAEAGQKQRQRADHRDGELDRRREIVEHMRAGDQIDARRHHGRGVDERADRRRAGHRVGQPGLQRQLRRFADGAAEQQRRRGDRQRRSHRPMRDGSLHQRLDVERAQIGEEDEQADRHRGVADPGDDERLARGEPVDGIAIPEADQEIAAEADALPAEIEEQQVVRQHQHQHRGDEQVHVGEEAAVALVRAHELGGVEVDEKADEGDDQHHQARQRVEVEADMRREAGDGDPGPDDLV